MSDTPEAKFILSPHAANSLPTLAATTSPPMVVQIAPALVINNANVTPCLNLITDYFHKVVQKTVLPSVVTLLFLNYQ